MLCFTIGMPSEESTTAPIAKTSRRTVAKGIAWSVPVVAAAVPAQSVAASGFCVGTVCLGGVVVQKCCPPGQGNNFYWARVTFTNNGTIPVIVAFSFTLTPSASGSVSFIGGGLVTAGQTRTFLVRGSTTPDNCSNATYPAFNITFTAGGQTGTTTVPAGSTGGNTCDGAPTRAGARQTLDEASDSGEAPEGEAPAEQDQVPQEQVSSPSPAPVESVPTAEATGSTPAGDQPQAETGAPPQ